MVSGVEVSGVDSCGSGGGHEIGIIAPAGDDVDVEMLGDASAGGAA